jgi:hypothetical protein
LSGAHVSVEVDRGSFLWYTGGMNKPKAMSEDDVRDAVEEIGNILFSLVGGSEVEFVHVIVGKAKDQKQIRLSYPKRRED